jgi:hypothetical protein
MPTGPNEDSPPPLFSWLLRVILPASVVAHILRFIATAYPADLGAMLVSFLLLVALGLLTLFAFLLLFTRRNLIHIVAPLLLTALLVINYRFAPQLAFQIRFALIRSSLERDVLRLQSGLPAQYWTEPPRIDDSGGTTALTPIAFVDGGLLDNWAGFVFDPLPSPHNPVRRFSTKTRLPAATRSAARSSTPNLLAAAGITAGSHNHWSRSDADGPQACAAPESAGDYPQNNCSHDSSATTVTAQSSAVIDR